MKKQTYSVQRAAVMTGRNEEWIRQLVRAGRIESVEAPEGVDKRLGRHITIDGILAISEMPTRGRPARKPVTITFSDGSTMTLPRENG